MFILALNYQQYSTSETSQFFVTIAEYIEKFYDIFDVVNDVRPYLRLFTSIEAAALRNHHRELLDKEEEEFDDEGEDAPKLKLIRMRMVHFKLNKILGSFAHLDQGEKLKLVNTIIQTYLWANGYRQMLNDSDRMNLDDVVVVAVELLHEIKIYERSVLNPINFMIISILEHAIKKSDHNATLRVWLMRTLSKLGLSTRYTFISKDVDRSKEFKDRDFEKFGALKYSHYQTHGTE
mmetsp:Transcript_5018/g.7531  ORF Transcript_5018/g.7531 Transcript_5018/m.7531 type:complete len:235 (+) Transcript_5018:1087-1791(+)